MRDTFMKVAQSMMVKKVKSHFSSKLEGVAQKIALAKKVTISKKSTIFVLSS